MRSDPADYTLVAPSTLSETLALLRDQPGAHTPIAGGTELMVAFNTGRLAPRSLLSLHHLRELRFIDAQADAITLGSGTTFSDLRRHPQVLEHLPLLAQAASWTGSIANQNRGTLGGNIVNASPAADSSPALLVYDAAVTLISASGQRSIPYREFHLGYKRTALRPDELVQSLTVPTSLTDRNGYKSYIRKVGTRNAQAISKVVVAGILRLDPSSATTTVTDLRLAAASLADRPIRLLATERALLGQPLTPAVIQAARAALLSEAKPIDDIRSTANYRASVAANLLEDFLSAAL